MKKTAIFLLLIFCIGLATAAFADDLNVGTWKLNEEKSKVPAGAAKNSSVVYTAEGGSYKCVTDGVDAKGAKAHTEWTGKFDGKDYPLKGDATADTRAVTKVDAHHYKIANKKAGKAVLTGVVEISGDGKTRILTTSGTDASGKKITATTVYEKQ
jgi:hypothetical protein